MSLIDPSSLVYTLDNFNQKLLDGETIPQDEGQELASWITNRQGLKGSYRGMYAPTPTDFEQGIRVFTGEILLSASARHILGQESARALCLLNSQDSKVQTAYSQATGWMQDHPEFITHGTFCCGRCTMAYWRHVWVGDFEDKENRITRGLESMRTRRSGDGHWQSIPFFYAVYTLLSLDFEPALAELSYARPVMERYLRRSHPDKFAQRKTTILEKAMNLVA